MFLAHKYGPDKHLFLYCHRPGCFIINHHNITQESCWAMLSMKNSESAAQTMGVSSLKYRLLAFVIATVFAMIAGYL